MLMKVEKEGETRNKFRARCFSAVILCVLCFGFWCISLRSPFSSRFGRWLEHKHHDRTPMYHMKVRQDPQGEPSQSDKQFEEEVKPCKTLSTPTLQWGWAEACNLIVRGDETCELFLASNMFRDETSFIETASRAADPYKPSLIRLKSRIAEAVLEDRTLNILALGASNTVGRGCPSDANYSEYFRWSGALQNLSNFAGSPLPLTVINVAAGGTTLRNAWHSMLYPYKDHNDLAVDLVVIDYELSEPAPLEKKQHLETVVLVQNFVQSWKRPPAILFLEQFNGHTFMRLHRTDACNITRNFENETAFYSAAKELKLPLLSYPDIACRLPGLNRTSRSKSTASFLDVYPHQSPVHFGCGVHLILAHAINLYLNKLLQDSCGAKPDQTQLCIPSLKQFCAAGFYSTLESIEESELGVDVFRLSPEGRCEMNILDSWSFAPGNQFPALTSTKSNWHAGADRPQKFGWIANEQPMIPLQRTDDQNIKNYEHFMNVSDKEIIFFLRLSAGIVFLDILGTYENIGEVSCQLEDLKGSRISNPSKFTGLWKQKHHRYSMSKREMLSAKAGQVPKLPLKGPNAALRCRETGKKFKFIGISSC